MTFPDADASNSDARAADADADSPASASASASDARSGVDAPVVTESQSVTDLRVKYGRSKLVNIVLGAVVVFLGVVLAAQFTSASPASIAAPGPSSSAGATGSDATGAPVSGADAAAEFAFVKRQTADPMAIGDVDAPVVMVLWTDFRCPYCAVFNRDTLPTIVNEYVDAGTVRIEVHDVAFFGEQSEDAAVAAAAAAEQGHYFPFLTAVYSHAPGGGHPDLPRETLIAYAEEAGVPDIALFTADLDREDLRAAARAETQQAQQLGVNSVPFFVAGRSSIAGAQPIEVFRDFLDDALAKAG